MTLRRRLALLLDLLANNGLARGISLTMISFVVLAASGIVINVAIVIARNSDALGVFNQAYSIYIVASQFAACGLHYSTMRSAAYYENDPDELGKMLISAILPALLFGTALATLLYLSEPLFTRIFDSPEAGEATAIASLGLAFFPLNKVLVAFVNGLRHMAAFSILQAARYFIIMAVSVGVAFSTLPLKYAMYCFVIAELITAIAATVYIARRHLCRSSALNMAWVRRHFAFGFKSFAAGIFGEVNTRIDVVMLGIFLDDKSVGVYSFAALLIDGLTQVLAMIRVNYNPFLVGALRDRKYDEAMALLRKTRIRVPIVMTGLGALATLFFILACLYVIPGKGLLAGLPTLLILLAGMIAVSGFIPFDNLMLVDGRPLYQTIQQMIAVMINILGNLALIPIFGIEGAALGTALGFIAGTIALIIFARRFVGWNLLKA